jgi:hypothetical protein
VSARSCASSRITCWRARRPRRRAAACTARRLLVEDAAQALGIEAAGGHLGTLGDAGIFSFGRGKHVTCGSGMVMTNSEPIAAAIASSHAKAEAAPRRAAQRVPEDRADDDLHPSVAVLIRGAAWSRSRPDDLPRAGGDPPPVWTGGPASTLAPPAAGSNEAHRGGVAFTREVAAPGRRPAAPASAAADRRGGRDRTTARLDACSCVASSRVAYPTLISGIPEIAASFTGQRFPAASGCPNGC